MEHQICQNYPYVTYSNGLNLHLNGSNLHSNGSNLHLNGLNLRSNGLNLYSSFIMVRICITSGTHKGLVSYPDPAKIWRGETSRDTMCLCFCWVVVSGDVRSVWDMDALRWDSGFPWAVLSLGRDFDGKLGHPKHWQWVNLHESHASSDIWKHAEKVMISVRFVVELWYVIKNFGTELSREITNWSRGIYLTSEHTNNAPKPPMYIFGDVYVIEYIKMMHKIWTQWTTAISFTEILCQLFKYLKVSFIKSALSTMTSINK